MEVTINYNGQAVAVEVTLEVYEFLDRADHKTENLFHEQRLRHSAQHAANRAEHAVHRAVSRMRLNESYD